MPDLLTPRRTTLWVLVWAWCWQSIIFELFNLYKYIYTHTHTHTPSVWWKTEMTDWLADWLTDWLVDFQPDTPPLILITLEKSNRFHAMVPNVHTLSYYINQPYDPLAKKARERERMMRCNFKAKLFGWESGNCRGKLICPDLVPDN